MLIDANLLLFAVHRKSAFHPAARHWLTEQLNGPRRVGLPWQSLAAFLRISTHPRLFDRPFGPEEAWGFLEDCLSSPVAWIPSPGPDHARIVKDLLVGERIRGNLVADAFLAALAI